MVPQVTTLTGEGQFDVVAHPLPPPPVDGQLMDNDTVGFESKFQEVWESVQNNDYPVVGLVGMGGVGKTRLLKQLNNEFFRSTHAYDFVVWIGVSRSANLGNIRSALLAKLNIPSYKWENTSKSTKNSLILNKLKKIKFVVLLDDIWDRLQLSEVGIPQPSKDGTSKIVFTTRSREVCRSMDAYKVVEVGCLAPDEAFSLFYSKLQEDILKSHPEMRGLITDVVSECEGLPLALITIGGAMKDETDARQWKEAKRILERYPSIFPGLEGVFSKLVFSYDSLPNPMIKKCFEYCSLYPEDHNILEEEVIKLWLAEGFICEYDNMHDALIQGRQMMESLKQACLLDTGERLSRYDREEEKTVKMHDVIRDMALWIACERGEKKNKFGIEVASRDDIAVAPSATTTEKISLWGNGITTESLVGMSCCSNLATLMIQDTEVEEMPGEIFASINVLKVLHLSGNRYLMRFPKGCFLNLEYLNVVGSRGRLPAEVSQWKKLRYLMVDHEMIIPRKVISSLSSLQMFEQLYVMTASDRPDDERKSMEKHMLSELEGLKHIMDIRLTLHYTSVEILLDSPKLQRCTTRLVVKEATSPVLDFGTEALTEHLERLDIHFCQMSEIKLGRPSLGNCLYKVSVSFCDKIRNLSSLIYVSNLRILDVKSCSSMSELIGEETRGSSGMGTSLFSSLTSLTLVEMPKLRSICPQSALPFPSLKYMGIYRCYELVKLPLDSNTVSTVPHELIIEGDIESWDGLEWESQATKEAFTHKYRLKF